MLAATMGMWVRIPLQTLVMEDSKLSDKRVHKCIDLLLKQTEDCQSTTYLPTRMVEQSSFMLLTSRLLFSIMRMNSFKIVPLIASKFRS